MTAGTGGHPPAITTWAYDRGAGDDRAGERGAAVARSTLQSPDVEGTIAAATVNIDQIAHHFSSNGRVKYFKLN
jgi:hypothetical protein